MNISFSFLERVLVYGPQLVAAVSAVLILALEVFPQAIKVEVRVRTYRTAAAAIFFLCGFLFVYTSKNFDIINGLPVLKMYVLLLALFSCVFVLVIKPEGKDSGPYVLCLAAFACAHAAFMADNPLIVFSAFLVFDFLFFVMIYLKKENAEYAGGLMPAKIIFGMAGFIFVCLFAFSAGKNAKMSQAGAAIFMLLFSTPGLLAIKGNEPETGENFLRRNSPYILISGIMTAIVTAKFLNAAGPAIRPVMVSIVILACFNIYRAITEEKYQAFSAHDSINSVFLLAALSCAADLPQGQIVFPAALFILSVFLQNEFIFYQDHGRHTVTAMKYSFEKVKAGKTAFFGLIAGLAAEIWVFILLYKYLKQDALILAAVIFLALAFAVSMMNKLFMIFSMLNRFRMNKAREPGLKTGAGRVIMFTVFMAVVIAAWLK